MYNHNIGLKVLFCFLILLAFGCRKDDYIETTTIMNPPIVEIVETGLSGLVSDENGQAIAGATVTARSQTTTTDANGYFFFSNVVLDGQGSLVTVEKGGHFTGYKQVFPTKQGESFTHFSLVPKGQPQTFSSGSGATIEIDGMAEVVFPADGIVYTDGQSFSGTVRAYATYFDPTDGNTLTTMPGNLGGEDAQGSRVQLGTYGMVGVELEDSNGRKLQLKEGVVATISLDIPSEILASAPEAIPLWHFDEQRGIWLEEGEASKDGNRYIGQVSHFSFWNCDRPWPAVKLKLTLVDEFGSPINAYRVAVRAEGVGCASGVSNAFGEVSGFVPAGVELTLVAYSCGEIVVEQSLGSLSQDTDVGTVEIVFLLRTTTIQGRLLDCLDQPNSKAYGLITYNGYHSELVTPDADGIFSKTVTTCTTIESAITFYDKRELTTSQTIEIDPNIDVNELGDITVCDDIDEYIRFSVNGDIATEALVVSAAVDLVDGTDLKVVTVEGPSGTPSGANFELEGAAIGDHIPTSVDLYDSVLSSQFGNFGCGEVFDCNEFIVSIISIGSEVGEYVTGTFSGTLQTFPTENNPDVEVMEIQVDGQFRLKIDYAYQAASISGRVWFDSDGDGVRTAADPFVQPHGVVIAINELLDEERVYEIVQLSNDGTYEFPSLRPGDYTVILQAVSDFNVTGINIGDDAVDNDFGPVVAHPSVQLTLAEGQDLTNVDCGLLPTDNLGLRLRYTGCQFETQLIINVLDGVPPYTIEVDGVSQQTTVEQLILLDLPGGQTYDVKVTDAFMAVEEQSFFLPENGVELYLNVFEELDPTIDGKYNISEKLVDDVIINVYNEAGTLVESLASTQSSGDLDITELADGKYYFEAELPVGFTFTNKPTFTYGANIIDVSTGKSELFDIECNDWYYFFIGIVAE